MKRTLLSLVIGVSMTTGALADDLMQVYQQALANDPLVNQAKAQRDAAFEGISLSRASLLPQISGSVGYTYYKIMKYLVSGEDFFTLPALSVAKKVYIALISKNPKTQYFVTLPTYVLSYLRILPNPIFENFLSLLDNQRENK